MDHLAELRSRSLLFLRIGNFLDKVCLFGGVARAEQKQTIRWKAIAPGASGFLIVALDVFWQVMMDDPADVGFVYAHAKGNRCTNDPSFIPEKKVLVFGAHGSIQARVVRSCCQATRSEGRSDALGTRARSAINNPALVPPLR